MASSREHSAKKLGELIQTAIQTKNRVWISDSQNNKKFSFKTSDEASGFILLLDKLNIKSHKFPGKSKSIQKEDPYFVVFLTAGEMTILQDILYPQKFSQSSNPSPSQAGKFQAKPTAKYNTQQQRIYDFASNCCDFPELVVRLHDDFGYHPNDSATAINKLAQGGKVDMDKLVAHLKLQQHKPKQ